MRPSSTMRLALSFLIFALCTQDGLSQTTFDESLVSTDKELNFYLTDKRGIKGDDGTIYFVENKRQTIVAYDNKQKVKWTADILQTCPTPVVGKLEIRYIKLTADKIQITFGKHDYASVDIADGKIKCLGAD